MRALDGLADPVNRKSLQIRISARKMAATAPGQHLLICLANLIGRMTDLVTAIEIDLPDVETIVAMPHHVPTQALPAEIASLVEWAVGKQVAVTIPDESSAADIHLCIGEDVTASAQSVALHAVANGWLAWIGTANNIPQIRRDQFSNNPLGPFFAATLLAGEVFKRARGITRGRLIDQFGYSLWTGQQGAWGELIDGPELSGRLLPAFYLIGAGAVGQALLNIIGAAGLGSSYVVTIDDDHHDITNFNRCFLAGVEDEKQPKIDAVRRYREIAGIGGYEFPGTLNDYVSRPKPGLRLDLLEQEAQDRFECVVSCVDKGTSRQDIQGLWPKVILGGSTLGLSAKTNLYDLAENTPCLGCHNEPEKDGEQLRRVEQQVRTMTPEQRSMFLEGVPNLESVMKYLAASEKCGMAGEADFRTFATQRTREFSVSFVSMAAAILLASRLLKSLLFAVSDPFAPLTSLAFLNGSVQHSALSVDKNCLKCGGRPKAAFLANSPFGRTEHTTIKREFGANTATEPL